MDTTRLMSHPFLEKLAPSYLDLIVQWTSVEQFAIDQPLLLEGKPANKFFLIDRGEVLLRTFISASHGFTNIQRLRDGEVVGWSWLVPPHHWHFSAFATKPSQVFVINGQHLREQIEADHDFGYEIQKRLMRVIGQRLRRTRKQLG